MVPQGLTTYTNYVTGPYRFEVLENARNFALPLEPERITELLVEHLTQHD